MDANNEPTRRKKRRHYETDELQAMERLELMKVIDKLQKKVIRLSTEPAKAWKLGRPFDFSRFASRQIALKVAYIGWDFNGFACQENTSNTIEENLLDALKRSCLIKDRSEALYSRCGRTDKGVSAFGQVVSVKVRSKHTELPQIDYDASNSTGETFSHEVSDELNYVKMLNKILPSTIRVLGWMPVSDSFNARFDCLSRTYKYFVPAGTLNIEKMQEAALLFVGEHDFRNFCKVDVGNNVNHFMRRVVSLDVRLSESESVFPMAEFTICGTAFLWHQIRCMITVLVIVGTGLEDKSIVSDLLNIKIFPKKPQYNMASEIPLVLYDCEFSNRNWICDEECSFQNFASFQSLLSDFSVRSSLVGKYVNSLRSSYRCLDTMETEIEDNKSLLWLPGCKRASYVQFSKRHVCEGLDRYLAKQDIRREAMKRKYTDDSNQNTEEKI